MVEVKPFASFEMLPGPHSKIIERHEVKFEERLIHAGRLFLTAKSEGKKV